jgi:transposase
MLDFIVLVSPRTNWCPEKPGAAHGELITAAQRPTPPAQNQPPGAHQAELVICDQAIERCFLRFKQFGRVATRYAKTAASFLAFATLGAITVVLRW